MSYQPAQPPPEQHVPPHPDTGPVQQPPPEMGMPPYPNYGIPQNPPPGYGYPPPGYYPGGPLPPGMPGPLFIEPPTSPMAITSLITGIAGIVGFPVIGAILALIFGYMARNEIRKSQGRIGGQNMAMAGIILGYVGIGLTVLIAIFVVFVFAVTATSVHQNVATPVVAP